MGIFNNSHEHGYDVYIMDRSDSYNNTGQVRRARRQLQRRWAVRNPPDHRNWIHSYCERLSEQGYLVGDIS